MSENAAAPACEPRPARSHGYFEATRSEDALALIRHYPLAYTLAAVIAHRARWRNDRYNPANLQFGEAFLGDFANYGMTEREYRTAKKILKSGAFATFKTTNKGTIGKLIDTRLFRINPSKSDGQNATPATGVTASKTTTNLNSLKAVEPESDKAFSTKARANKLSTRQKELADRFEAALGNEWVNDAGKWVNRIKDSPDDCESVIGETESAARENRIDTTPARFAEYFWQWLRKQPLAHDDMATASAQTFHAAHRQGEANNQTDKP